MLGRVLDHFDIVEKLGEGGMGVVYKARDLNLNRFVAIKVLPPGQLADPQLKLRLIQEARSASALNHPNIITIYDVRSHEDGEYIVMEYVDGKTLKELIGRKRLRLNEALQYAIAIADALVAAHTSGILHRDIKPSNVMVSSSGVTKVLDFGLAKAAYSDPVGADLLTRTLAPDTEEGKIVGTIAYMSPEQAQGLKVDARSDIFSFGSLLYEMLAGRPAFSGLTKISTLSAILNAEPQPLSELSSDVPPELQRLIERCLRKDPDRRIQHMDDVKLALVDLKEDSTSGKSGGITAGRSSTQPALPRGRAMALLWGLLVVAALAAGLVFVRNPSPQATAPILMRVTSDGGLTTDPALSPDAKLLAYASDRGDQGNLDLWVRAVSGGEAVRLTRHQADDREPSFSPDGSQIAFRSDRGDGGIYLVSVLGGEERLIATQGKRPRFSPDGKWIAFWAGEDTGVFGSIWVLPASGGEARRLDTGLRGSEYPVWSPDSRHILFLARSVEGPADAMRDWWVIPLEGGSAVRLNLTAMVDECFCPPDEWIGNEVYFARKTGDSTNLWKVALARGFQPPGSPQRVTFGTAQERFPTIGVDKAGNTHIAFSSLTANSDVWLASWRAGHRKADAGELLRLTDNTELDDYPSLSTNRTLVFTSRRSGNSDVWLKELGTGIERPLTVTPVDELWPKITADGSRVAYAVFKEKRYEIYTVPTGGGVAQKVCDDCGRPEQWLPGGTQLVYERFQPRPSAARFDVGLRSSSDFLRDEQMSLYSPRLSSTQDWVAFHAIVGLLKRQIFVAPVNSGKPDYGKRVPVTDGSALDREPAWSPDDNVLYFLSERDGWRCVWEQQLHPATKHPVGKPAAFRHFHSARRSLRLNDTAATGLSVVSGTMTLTLNELTGNIWMLKITAR